MIKLVSIDDHRLFSDGLRAIIAQEKDMVLLRGGYQDGDDVLTIVSDHQPDIVLLDMYLPGTSGLTIAKEIRSQHPNIKLIILSSEVRGILMAELENIGVEGYVSKELDATELIDVIRKVYAGETMYGEGPIVLGSLDRVLATDFGFTKRELEIYYHIRHGKSSQEIADLLGRSVMTISTHRKNMRQKIRTNLHHHNLFDEHDLSNLLRDE